MMFDPRKLAALARLVHVSALLLSGAALASLSGVSRAAAADVQVSVVSVGGTDAVLLKPARPRASIILLTGGPGVVGIDPSGEIRQGRGNQLVRTRQAYAARGFAVLVPNSGFDLAALVSYMGAIKRPVTVAGTSRGTQRAARGIAAGARPDKLVLTSGFLSDESGDRDNVESILGSPGLLPPTLVVHNRNDACAKTTPAGVAPFLAWSQGRARVTWLSGGTTEGDPCEAFAYHGFNGLDGQVVSVVSAFAGR
jgi:hypothetical protein